MTTKKKNVWKFGCFRPILFSLLKSIRSQSRYSFKILNYKNKVVPLSGQNKLQKGACSDLPRPCFGERRQVVRAYILACWGLCGNTLHNEGFRASVAHDTSINPVRNLPVLWYGSLCLRSYWRCLRMQDVKV